VVADAGVVDHGIEAAECVDLLGDATGAADGGEVPHRNGFSLRQFAAGVFTTRLVSRVKRDPMPLLCEPGRRSGNEHTRHDLHPSICRDGMERNLLGWAASTTSI
jgi:hypothetical protein